MTISSFALGRATSAGERDVIWRTPYLLDRPQTTEGVLFFHGSGETALTTLTDPSTRDLLAEVSKRAVVIAADFGLQAWGNDTAIARAVQAMNYGEANLGVVGPWTFITGSMGNANGCATALAYPTRVKAIAGIIPLTDIADVMLRGAAASVNAAYPPAYDDAINGPTHSPIHFAEELDPDMPMHFWTASNDPIVVPATSDAFIAARPQTGRTDVGPLGHSDAAVVAAASGVVDFVNGVFQW